MYEGVDPEPVQYHGSSAAQSSSVHAFDVFLGGTHTGSDTEFLQTMRHYMPAKHKDFLEVLTGQPSVRKYIKQCKGQGPDSWLQWCSGSGVARTSPMLGHNMGTLRLYEFLREVQKLLWGSRGIFPQKI